MGRGRGQYNVQLSDTDLVKERRPQDDLGAEGGAQEVAAPVGEVGDVEGVEHHHGREGRHLLGVVLSWMWASQSSEGGGRLVCLLVLPQGVHAGRR